MNDTQTPVRVAYLVNQYPKTSHAWIRRELRALERLGFAVERFSVRRVREELVDPDDRAEAERTRVLLDAGAAGLAGAVLRRLVRAPGALLRGVAAAARQGWRSPRGFFVHFVYLAEACLLLEHLERASLRHVHAHFASNSATVTFLVHALGGPRFSFTFHGPEIFEFPAFGALREKLHAAAFAVAISHHGRSTLMRFCDVAHWPRIHLVHCGVDDTYRRAEPTPVPHERRLVCVARLDPVKGHFVLLEALARLAREGREFRLELVGGGALEDELRADARRLGLEERVVFAGWQDGAGVRRAVQTARLMVLPSFDEGLPVVFMEAYALGRPVLSTYVAGIPELVVPGRSGWLVPAGSVEHLVDALREALDADDATIASYAEHGRRQVHVEHDVEGEARKLAELFRAALAAAR